MSSRDIEIDRAEHRYDATFDEAPGWLIRWRRARRARVAGDEASFDDDAAARRGAWVPAALLALVVAGFVIRLSMSEHLSSHVDESASIMAAREVAATGVPIFPSRTLYLQGATLSYILAPFVLAGYGDLDDLAVMRLPSVFAGSAAIVAMFLLARFVTGSAAAGILGAALLAFDPVSVRWSSYVRMYALLQFLCLLVLWLFLRALLGPPNRRLLQVMVVVFWISVFTHIATMLLWPGMALCAFIVHRWSLRDQRRDLTIALAACLAAPFALLFLNQLVEPPDKAVSSSIPGVSFVGDYFITTDQLLHPNIESWLLLFRRTALSGILPTLIVAVSCLLLGRYFLASGVARGLAGRRRIVGMLLVLYWLPIALVSAFSSGAEERYLLHIHPIGFLLLSILIVDLLGWRQEPIATVAGLNGATSLTAASAAPAPLADDWSLPRAAAPKRRAVADDRAVEPAATVAAAAAVRPLSRTLALSLLGVIAALGAGLRLFHLNHLSLWLDEGFTVLYSRLPWDSVLGLNGYYSPHPPLFFATVKAVAFVTGDQYAARTISVLSAIATLPVFYALSTRLLDRRAALVATAVLALSPMSVYYAQEGRMYALLVLLVSLTYLALVRFWQGPAWRWAILYGAAGLLAMYVDYSAVYALAPQAIPLAFVALRHRQRATPLFLGVAGAAILYAPWLPTVVDTVSGANEETRRESYLGATPDRIWTALLSVVGLAGDSSYFYGSDQAPWNRLPQFQLLFLLAYLPIIALGVMAIRHRRGALTITACLLGGTILVAIWISLISPGFAERTILTATLGWAMLAGAAFREGIRRERLLVAAGSLAAVLLASILTLSAILGGGQKQQWRAAAAAVARASPWGMPLVTYSYGAVADTLLDVYEPDLLGNIRHVTIRDGELENTLSGGVLPEVGLTRADLAAGRLRAALPPDDPANAAVWYLYPPRTGEREVHAAFQALGYERVFRRLYDHPRYRLWLDLYLQPGARLGEAQDINGTFADDAAGWTMPASGASFAADDAGGHRLSLSNNALSDTTVTRDIAVNNDVGGEGIYTVAAETLTGLPGTAAQLTVSCLDASGLEIVSSGAEAPSVAAAGGVWSGRRAAVWCPAGTSGIRITLGNIGIGDVAFRQVTLDILPRAFRQ